MLEVQKISKNKKIPKTNYWQKSNKMSKMKVNNIARINKGLVLKKMLKIKQI